MAYLEVQHKAFINPILSYSRSTMVKKEGVEVHLTVSGQSQVVPTLR